MRYSRGSRHGCSPPRTGGRASPSGTSCCPAAAPARRRRRWRGAAVRARRGGSGGRGAPRRARTAVPRTRSSAPAVSAGTASRDPSAGASGGRRSLPSRRAQARRARSAPVGGGAAAARRCRRRRRPRRGTGRGRRAAGGTSERLPTRLRRESWTTRTPRTAINAASCCSDGSCESKRESRAFRPKATAAVRLHRARLASIAGSWPKTEAATSADFQRAHAPPSARCGAHSVLSQRMRAAWSAALAIVMLSIGSNCTTQSCGCAASSDISHDEPELDSKRTTKGTGGGNGSAEALATLASGGSGSGSRALATLAAASEAARGGRAAGAARALVLPPRRKQHGGGRTRRRRWRRGGSAAAPSLHSCASHLLWASQNPSEVD